MAVVNFASTFCKTGGEHATCTFRVAGVVQGVYVMQFADLQVVVTDEEKKLFTRLYHQLHLIGKTPAQLRSDMLAAFGATI